MTLAAQRVARAADIAVGTALRVELDAVPVAIVRDSEGQLHAIGDVCSHADVSLSEGEVEGCTIECWAHGSRFDLNSGEPLSLPAYEPVPVFELTVRDDDVYVDITKVLNDAEVETA
ncbi:non-heme iron oxygenase ferredoxin subunit [Acaricomes phytoseiuli]|uniref:non-heme iron oxygenase ferredoxin subunit n=1 Tax=Acaricomes phytoseiuli TaxID=291968 RepID=UPI00037007B8